MNVSFTDEYMNIMSTNIDSKTYIKNLLACTCLMESKCKKNLTNFYWKLVKKPATKNFNSFVKCKG